MATIKDFDRFIAEREDKKTTIHIFGRDIQVPAELPWHYVMKVERMLQEKTPISGEDNVNLIRQMLSPDDFKFVTEHPEFRASYFWEIIAFTWLRSDAAEKPKSTAFKTEDEVRIEETQRQNPKK